MSVENIKTQENLLDAQKNTKEALKKFDIEKALSSRILTSEVCLSEKEGEYKEEFYLTEQCLNFSEEKTQMFCTFFDEKLLQTT